MSTILRCHSDAVPPVALPTRETATWLTRALDVPVAVWQGGGPWECIGVWCLSSDREDPAENTICFDSPEALGDDDARLRMANILEARGCSSHDPQTLSLGAGQAAIAVPIDAGGSDPLVVTAEVDDETAPIVCQLVEIARERDEFARSVDDQQNQLDICTVQISDDFEELAFLRSIAEALEAADLTSSLEEMAEGVIPHLRMAIKAQEIVLFLAARPGDRRGAKMIRCERTDLPDAACTRILSVFQPEHSRSAVIRNNCDEGEHKDQFRGIECFILMPVTKSGIVMGWLLAINRSYREGFEDAAFLSHLSKHEFGTEEASLVASAASMIASHGFNCEQYRQREELLIKVVRALVSAIEAKDPYTCGHSERVALFARRLAEEIGLDKDQCEQIYLSGLLHDVGKIGISDATLGKPGRLTAEEYNEIKRHPDLGWDILCELTQLSHVLPGVVHHHERIDGKGYPDSLAGDEIPLDGRIMAVADAFDAMTSDRPYRDGMPNQRAFEILRDGAGSQWDTFLIDTFVRIAPDVEAIQQSYQRPPQVVRTGPVLADDEPSFAELAAAMDKTGV